MSKQAGPLLGRRAFCALALAGAAKAGTGADQVTVAYQVLSGNAWPLFIAEQGGYYEKYRLAVRPVLSAYPGGVAMLRDDQKANYAAFRAEREKIRQQMRRQKR